jgi:hypothetical protein
VETLDALLARILDAAARIRKRDDQIRRATPVLRTRVANCVEVYGGIYEHLLRTVKKKIVTSVTNVPDFLSSRGSGTGATQPREVN